MRLQAKRADLEKQVQVLSELVSQLDTEYSRLRLERDTLSDMVCALQALQQRQAHAADARAQVKRLHTLPSSTLPAPYAADMATKKVTAVAGCAASIECTTVATARSVLCRQ